MKIKLTSVYVDDQDKALRFYTEVLGFAKKADFSKGPFRWLTVASPEEPDGTELQLALNNNPAAKAYQQAMFQQGQPAAMFYTDDVKGDYERIKARGAEFTMPPTDVTASTIAMLNGMMSEPTIFEHPGALLRFDVSLMRSIGAASRTRSSQVFGTQGRPGHVEHLAAQAKEVAPGGPIRTRANWAVMERCYGITRIVRSRKRSASDSWRSSSKRPTRPGLRTTRDFVGAFASTSNGAPDRHGDIGNRARTSRPMSRHRGGHGSRWLDVVAAPRRARDVAWRHK